MHPVILIPSRYAATRLPGKPLADIAGKPMIVRVWEQAAASGLGPVWVATDHEDIFRAVEAAGGKAVMTRANHASGSDRIYEALQIIDPAGAHDAVINLQGDMPTIDPAVIAHALELLQNPAVDIGTLAAEISEEWEKESSAVVKAVLGIWDWGLGIGGTANPKSLIPDPSFRALYFSRAAVPTGPGPLYHHIGIYAWRREALERFVQLPPSPLEMREKLEQLRALEAGMRIDVAVVDTVPLGVDTPELLEKARKLLA